MRRISAFAAIYLCWGGTFLAIRYLVTEMPPLLSMAVRCAGGAAVFFLWLVWRGTFERADAVQWRTALVSGVFLFLGCHGILAWAEQRVASGEAALLMTSIPLWLVSLDGVRRKEWPSGRVLLGLMIGVGGVALLTLYDGAWSGSIIDRIALVASGFCWALGSLIGRDGPKVRSVVQVTAMTLAAGALALTLGSLASGELVGWSFGQVSRLGVGALAFLILGGTVLGFGAYTWLLQVASPAAVGSYAFVNPIVAILLAQAAGDGQLTATTALAGVVVVVAVVFVRQPGRAGAAQSEVQTASEPAR